MRFVSELVILYPGAHELSINKHRQVENYLHIKNWPEEDRPREMLLDKGPEALSDAALLAILLRTGRQGQNAIALAREMINRFGGLNWLMMATSEDLLGKTPL
jgi:DNA repair protein RadC